MTGSVHQESSASADDVTGGAGDDAVSQAARWLAERGIVVPPDRTDGTDGPASAWRRRPPAELPDRSDQRGQAQLPGSPDPPDSPSSEAVRAASAPDRPSGRSSAGAGDPADPDADPEAVARTIVLRKLAVQARTRAELSKALEAKQVPEDAAEAVLDRMESIGLIDDEGFARDWVESRQQRRHLSRTALRRELSTKGVDRDEIEAALEPVDGEAELQAARSLAGKKVRAMAGLDQQVRYRRLAGMLGRRGFSPGVISRVVAEYVSTPPE